MYAFQRFLFENISDDPLTRFGIEHAEVSSLKAFSCLFSAYHALKADIRFGRINLHTSGWLDATWSVFANAIKAEAGEMQLATRAFSLPKFMEFVLHGSTSSLAIRASSHVPP